MAFSRAHGLDWKKVGFFALLFLYVSISAGKLDGINLVAGETNEVKGRRLIIQDQLDGPWKGNYNFPPPRPPPPPPPRSPSHCPPPPN